MKEQFSTEYHVVSNGKQTAQASKRLFCFGVLNLNLILAIQCIECTCYHVSILLVSMGGISLLQVYI